MAATPNLALPLLAAAQAQKHVTHNEALFAVDALLQAAVLDRHLATPPPSPAEGDRYIVGPSPTGDWAGKAGQVAAWQDGIWRFHAPRPGFLAFVRDEALLYVHDGTAWAPLSAGLLAVNGVGLLGVGTTADATNPFAAKLNSALWTARSAGEGGSGDLRIALSKEAPAKTLSLLLQSGYSGRAEIGLAGDDALRIKVSPDGTAWTTALRADPASGGIDLAAATTSLASAATCDVGGAPSLGVTITGTTAISSFGGKANAVRLLTFAGSLTLAHDPVALVLPTRSAITTATGDTAVATSDAAGNWVVRHYGRADGSALAPASGSVVAYSRATSAAFADVAAQTPIDDTVPQTSETTSVVSVSHVPKRSANLLHARAVLVGSLSAVGSAVACIFRSAETDAVAARLVTGSGGYIVEVVVDHWQVAGGTAALAFALRAGSNVPHLYVNGGVSGPGRILGGALACAIEVTEFAA